MQQVDQHLQQADLPKHITEHWVMPGQLQQRPDRRDAASVRRARLEQHADTEELLARHIVEAEDDKLQQLEVLGLGLREFGHAICKLRQGVLRLQDEVVGRLCCVDVSDGIEEHAGQAARFSPQEGIL